MKNLLVISDPHIKESEIDECNLVFDEILEIKKHFNIDTFICAGDSFDRINPSSLEIDCLSSFLAKLNIPTILIAAKSHESISNTESILNHFGILNPSIQILPEYIDDNHLFIGHFILKESKNNYGATRSKNEFKKYRYTVLGHQHCVTSDTEILTNSGWKKYHNLLKTDTVATFNMKTKEIEYQNVLNIHKYKYNGDMYEFEKRAMVTPNHRMILQNNEHKSPFVKFAYQIIHSDKMIINSRKWNYPILHNFSNPYWAELIGFIIGDGHYDFINTNHFTVSIRQKVGYNTKVYIPRLLKRCNLYYTIKRQNTKYPDFSISFSHNENKDFLNFLRIFVKDKLLNRLLISLPRTQLMRLYLGLITSDGHYYNKGNQTFSQTNYQNIELFEELCLKLGRQFKTYKKIGKNTLNNYTFDYEIYQVNVQNNKTKGNNLLEKAEVCNSNIKKISYNGIVWCPETPNGTWIAKRNGRPFITGNSFELIKPNCCQLGSIRFIDFSESEDKSKKILIITDYNEKEENCHFIDLKTPYPMKDLVLQKKVAGTEDLKGKPGLFKAISDLKSYLDQLSEKTKVRVIFKDYELWREFLPYWETYQNKFILFKDKKEFITQVINQTKNKQNISLFESLKTWLNENKIEDKIKEILIKEIGE